MAELNDAGGNGQMESMVTNRQAMELLKVDAVTLWRWRRDGKLPFYRVGSKLIRYRYSDLRRFIEPERASTAAAA